MIGNRPVRLAIAGAGGRGTMFARCATRLTGAAQVVAVADIHPGGLAILGDALGLPAEARFPGWQAMAGSGIAADAAVVAIHDKEHLGAALACLRNGWHVLLEKPMALSLEDCRAIAAAQGASGRVFAVCHSMRYQPGFQQVKELVDGGAIGRLVHVDMVEHVAFWHQAHSYVRGNAANGTKSGPMILTKSCHDLDWLCWLIGAPAERVSSFGSLSWFNPANAPAGAPARCSDGCPHLSTCTYSAFRCYVDTARRSGWPAAMCSPADHSLEAHLKAIKEGPYGRCVWHCDNDTVDHQVVSMEFPGGVTAGFTMTGLSAGGGRSLRVHGTLGELTYTQKSNAITIHAFGSGRTETIKAGIADEGHGGGDELLFNAFIDAVRSGDGGRIRTSADASLRSHAMCFAAEMSRQQQRTIELRELLP